MYYENTGHSFVYVLHLLQRAFMANILNTNKDVAVIGPLTEGSSNRDFERTTGVHRDTIIRLGVCAGVER